MAQQEEKPKAALSSKIMGLRFMQRAAEKKNFEQSQAAKAKEEEASPQHACARCHCPLMPASTG